MIVEEKSVYSLVEPDTPLNSSKIEALKKKINSEDYLFEAIQRIAFVLSNEIAGVPAGGSLERKR